MLTLILLLLGTVRVAGQAQETVNVTAIEVIAEVKDKDGQAPRDLTPTDFTLREDGVERRVIGVDYLGIPRRPSTAVAEPAQPTKPQEPAPETPPWHFVFYFESELSSASGRKQVAQAISAQAEDLARRGRVDVILATPVPAALVRNSRDPKAIRDALAKVAQHPGVNQLQMNRRRFRVDMVGRGTQLLFNDLRAYLEEDIVMLTRFRRNLSRWLSSYRRHAPRMAVVVTDGWDLDPVNYYSAQITSSTSTFIQAEMRAYASGLNLGTTTSDFAKELAGGSWIVTSVPSQMDMGMAVDDASTWGIGRVRTPVARLPGPKALVNQPMAPLQMLAEATGGTVIGNYSKFDEALDHLSRYVRITYQVSRPPDAKIRKIEVTSRRRDLNVRAQQWASASTPEETAEARAISLLSGAELPGQELPVQARMTLDGSDGEHTASVSGTAKLDALSGLIKESPRRNFRVTVAMLEMPKVHYVARIVPQADVSSGVFTFQFTLDLPGPVTKMAVTVEDLTTGAWGSTLATPSAAQR